MYFRSLSLFAAFACAGFAAAAPRPDGDLTNVLGNSASLPKLDTSVLPKVARSPVDTTAVTGALANVEDVAKFPHGPFRRDAPHPTLPEVVKTAAVKVTDTVSKIRIAISNKDGDGHGLLPGLVNDIVDVLVWANDALQYIVDHRDEFELTLDGVVVTLDVVVTYVTCLLYIILTTLADVVSSLDGDLHTTIIPLVGTIGGHLAHLLTNVLILVPDVLELITPTVKALVHIIKTLDLGDTILIVLHLG